MERLTTNKDVSEMNMTELAHNSCYVKDGFARYMDFENDYDARDLVRMLIKKYTGEDAPTDDEEFDEYIIDDLQYGMFSTSGFMALFCCNLWAMAELRENLKEYEDAEESGLLVRLPCRVGNTVYIIIPPVSSPPLKGWVYEGKIYDVCTEGFFAGEYDHSEDDYTEYNEIGKTVFFTKAEAEAKLKEMEGKNE